MTLLSIPAARRFTVRLGIGDQSGSHSEDYVMNVFELDPVTGAEKPFYTLRSGGHGQYKEFDYPNFLKDRSYSFQIDWQSTNGTPQRNAQGQITEGADFDYSFKVQPLGDTSGAILIDSYKMGIAAGSETITLLNDDASDVAQTAAEFSEKYERRRVGLTAVSITAVFGEGPGGADW